MQIQQPFSQEFYNRSAVAVAQDLIGAILVRQEKNGTIAGIITETEAYCGETDLACHAKAGKTKRTEPMYGPPGRAFVYLTYGMHWLFNCVTNQEEEPDAVLIRGIVPIEGLVQIESRRGHQPQNLWTNGPAKITQAMHINKFHNKIDLTIESSAIFLTKGVFVKNEELLRNPRIGLGKTPEPWKSIPWRFNAPDPQALFLSYQNEIAPFLKNR